MRQPPKRIASNIARCGYRADRTLNGNRAALRSKVIIAVYDQIIDALRAAAQRA